VHAPNKCHDRVKPGLHVKAVDKGVSSRCLLAQKPDQFCQLARSRPLLNAAAKQRPRPKATAEHGALMRAALWEPQVSSPTEQAGYALLLDDQSI
jgi:hypothetical protein